MPWAMSRKKFSPHAALSLLGNLRQPVAKAKAVRTMVIVISYGQRMQAHRPARRLSPVRNHRPVSDLHGRGDGCHRPDRTALRLRQ